MWTQASALLLLACCLRPAESQRGGSRRQSMWDEPITFNTKAKDQCTMGITGQREYTRLRLSCQSNKRSYWCEYMGKPYECGPYNKNPRHYFVQMMWELRKLHNACQAPRVIKPHMCRKESDDSQMVFSSASFSRSWSDTSRTGSRPAVRPQPRPASTRPSSTRPALTESIRISPRVKTLQKTSPQPAAPTVESYRQRIARQHCWRSMRRVCAFIIGLFQD